MKSIPVKISNFRKIFNHQFKIKNIKWEKVFLKYP